MSHTSESCHISISHVTYESVMSHMSELRNTLDHAKCHQNVTNALSHLNTINPFVGHNGPADSRKAAPKNDKIELKWAWSSEGGGKLVAEPVSVCLPVCLSVCLFFSPSLAHMCAHSLSRARFSSLFVYLSLCMCVCAYARARA